MADGSVTENTPTALYRHFDAEGKLLYVGISLSPTYRLSQHRDASRWFHRIVDIRIAWHASRDAALIAERDAIIAERPEFNIVHNREMPEPIGILERIADESRGDLTRRMVRYNPIYKVQAAAEQLGISGGKLRMAIEAGDLPAIRDGSKLFITGWALIAYMEALEAGLLTLPKMPVKNPYGPYGKPSAATSWTPGPTTSPSNPHPVIPP